MQFDTIVLAHIQALTNLLETGSYLQVPKSTFSTLRERGYVKSRTKLTPLGSLTVSRHIGISEEMDRRNYENSIYYYREELLALESGDRPRIPLTNNEFSTLRSRGIILYYTKNNKPFYKLSERTLETLARIEAEG